MAKVSCSFVLENFRISVTRSPVYLKERNDDEEGNSEDNDELELELPDVLWPQLGTDGTLIQISFTAGKTFTPVQNVNFVGNHFFIQQLAEIHSDRDIQVQFLHRPELEGILMAVFNVEVDGIVHDWPLQFTWVSPAIMESIDGIRKSLESQIENEEDYTNYGNFSFTFFFARRAF